MLNVLVAVYYLALMRWWIRAIGGPPSSEQTPAATEGLYMYPPLRECPAPRGLYSELQCNTPDCLVHTLILQRSFKHKPPSALIL